MDLDIWKKAKKEKKLTIAQIAEKANLPKGFDAHQITVSLYCNIFRLSIGLLKIFEKFLIAIRGFRNFANGCI